MNLNLENVKIGDEITIITPENGGFKYNGILTVSEWSEAHKAYRLKSKTNEKYSGILPADGKGYYAMHSKKTPHFYYSANPEHIAATKKAIQKERAKREKREKLLAAKNELLSPMLESYRDSEENYTFEFLSVESLQKLSLGQIETLKKWLDGGE